MGVVHTCPDVRYWSEVLCCTIMTHMNDLRSRPRTKADLENKYVIFLVNYFIGKARFSDSCKLRCIEQLILIRSVFSKGSVLRNTLCTRIALTTIFNTFYFHLPVHGKHANVGMSTSFALITFNTSIVLIDE